MLACLALIACLAMLPRAPHAAEAPSCLPASPVCPPDRAPEPTRHPPERPDGPVTGIFHGYDKNTHRATIGIDQTFTIIGDDAERGKIEALAPGDIIRFAPPEGDTLRARDIVKDNQILIASVPQRALAFLLAGLVILIPATMIARGRIFAWFVGIDNRTSNSQTQLILWSVTVLIVFLAAVFLRGALGWDIGAAMIGGVDIPQNLLAISGLSGLTFAGARAVTASQCATADANKRAAIADHKPADVIRAMPEKRAARHGTASFRDLFMDDGDLANPAAPRRLDLGDSQMILITIIAVIIYLVKSFIFMGQIEISAHVMMPDIDTYLLASFGLGQGAYLAKKAATEPGKG